MAGAVSVAGYLHPYFSPHLSAEHPEGKSPENGQSAHEHLPVRVEGNCDDTIY